MLVLRNFASRSLMYGLLVASICMPAVAMGLAYDANPQTAVTAQSTHVPMQYMIKRVDQPLD
ncbi:hypothetical protein [Salinisphaera aquimarina]|jgi:hypothetical protein|uniref:Uncharacterized protein n=1 Tax=Salinisphaera aquimarina TaxID=2094031 RepID=A0ABV7ETB7_9GAMM